MCNASSSLHYKRGSNCVPPTSLQIVHRRCWASHTWPHTCGCLVKSFYRSVDSCNKVLFCRYSSTIHHILHTISQKIIESCQIWWPRNWSLSTNPLIWISNFEVIPYVSTKVCRWLKGSFSNFDALHHPNREFPDRGSSLNNDQFAVLHKILRVFVFFGTPCTFIY